MYLGSVTAAYRSPKPLVGVQIPPGMPNAGVAQLVEHFLAKEDVTSSSLVTRSIAGEVFVVTRQSSKLK